MFDSISDSELGLLEGQIGNWFFVLSLVFLLAELLRYGLRGRLTRALLGDTVTNFLTLGMFTVTSYVLVGGFYVGAYALAQQHAPFSITTSWGTILVCLVLADLAYYWEHRFYHQVGIAWATHTVHHSSPHFNISVAYRFGPMDGVWGMLFHVPLALLGFNPLVVILTELLVQLYQTALHTEWIGRLPRPIEAVFNTPSHHRVHHGCNARYMDRNYAGILIVWDRLFGTFEREDEQEPVCYGVTEPIESVNPLVAFFHGFQRLGRDLARARGLRGRLAVLFLPPGVPR
jgi:sterol desaturase/sphingolipid hydroxylase (fatty acid hydroxylase superfamily)